VNREQRMGCLAFVVWLVFGYTLFLFVTRVIL
jgi:hypothetical protein